MFEERSDLGRKVFEKLFVFAEVGQYEEFTREEEEGGFVFGIFMLVEMCVDEVRYLYLVVYVVRHAVVSHVTDLIWLEFQILERVLKVIQIH